MSDRMTEAWIKGLYFEGDEAELWQKFKGDFVQKPEAVRLNDLHTLNQWLDQEDRPTREHAALLTKRREMEDLHRLLKGAGR